MTLEVPTASYLLDPDADLSAVLDVLAQQVSGTVELTGTSVGTSTSITSSTSSTSSRAASSATEPTTQVVYDTADRLLRAAQLELVATPIPEPATGSGPARPGPSRPDADGGDVVLVLRGAAGEPEVRATAAPARRYLVTDLPEGLLRERLEPVVGIRALLPIVQVRGHELPAAVRNRDDKIVVRLTVTQVTALPPADGTGHATGLLPGPDSPVEPVALHTRVEVAGVLGYPKPFAQVQQALAEPPLGLAEVSESVADEAVIALGGIPQGLVGKVEVGLLPGDRADVAAVRILRALSHVVESNVPGTIEDLDIEFLHDLRVAVRKSRSVLRELKRVFEPDLRRTQADALRWVQAVTGPTRDLDVQLLEWDELVEYVPPERRPHLEPVRALLRDRRAEAFETLAATLQGDEYRRRWSAWRAFLAGDLGPEDQRPDAALPVRDVAGRRIRTVYKRMIGMGRAIDDSSPAQALHDLRKRGKELRYLLELFGRLWPSEQLVKPMVTSLKGLQDVLGRHQDREVQATQLRALAPDLLTIPQGGADALLAMGSLIDRLETEQEEARRGFADRFAAFTGLEVPR